MTVEIRAAEILFTRRAMARTVGQTQPVGQPAQCRGHRADRPQDRSPSRGACRSLVVRRRIVRARAGPVLQRCGWQAARALQMNPEKAEAAVRNARKISKPRLLAGMRALQRADDRLKRGSEDSRAVMEFLITELSAPEAKAASR